jgi:hypothetical protein
MPRRTIRTPRTELTAEQQAESDRIFAALRQAAESDLRELADLLATKDDSNTFGATEFTVRDVVLRVGAKALQAALEGRKKGGTTGPAGPAPTATSPPSSSAGSPKPS